MNDYIDIIQAFRRLRTIVECNGKCPHDRIDDVDKYIPFLLEHGLICCVTRPDEKWYYALDSHTWLMDKLTRSHGMSELMETTKSICFFNKSLYMSRAYSIIDEEYRRRKRDKYEECITKCKEKYL